MTSPQRGGTPPNERRLLLVWSAIAVVAVVGAVVLVVVRLSGHSEHDMAATSTGLPPRTTTVVTTTTTSPPPTTTTTTRTRAGSVPGFAGPQPVDATATNPLTTFGSLGHRPCWLPPWGDDDVAARNFLQDALTCLDAAWRPVFDTLRLPFAPAKVVITDSTVADRCDAVPLQSSFYCDGTIYLVPASYLGTTTGPRGVPTAAIGMLAHEYGHHLQQLSGTLPASVKQMNAAGTGTPAGLETSRRAELQAQCLAGMFFGVTFDPASIALAQQDNYTRGDPPGTPSTHGSPQSWGDWFTKGLQRNALDVCNTWIAPPNTVS